MDKFRNIGLDKILTSVYDFGGLTTQEVWCKFAQKINIIIEHFNYLEKTVISKQELVNQKLEYLLNDGVTIEVANKVIELIDNGVIGNLINTNLLGEINKKIENNYIDLNNKYDFLTQIVNKKVITATVYDLINNPNSIKVNEVVLSSGFYNELDTNACVYKCETINGREQYSDIGNNIYVGSDCSIKIDDRKKLKLLYGNEINVLSLGLKSNNNLLKGEIVINIILKNTLKCILNEGEYYLSNAIIVQRNSKIQGKGIDTTKLILNNNANSYVIKSYDCNLNTFTLLSNNVELDGFTVDGNCLNNNIRDYSNNIFNSFWGFGLVLCNINNLRITNLKIINTEAWGISYWLCNNVYVDNLEFLQDSNREGFNGDGITGSAKNIIINNIKGFTNDDMVGITTGKATLRGNDCGVNTNINIDSISINNVIALEKNGKKVYSGVGIYMDGDVIISKIYINNVRGEFKSNPISLADYWHDDNIINTRIISCIIENVSGEHSLRGAIYISHIEINDLLVNNVIENGLTDNLSLIETLNCKISRLSLSNGTIIRWNTVNTANAIKLSSDCMINTLSLNNILISDTNKYIKELYILNGGSVDNLGLSNILCSNKYVNNFINTINKDIYLLCDKLDLYNTYFSNCEGATINNLKTKIIGNSLNMMLDISVNVNNLDLNYDLVDFSNFPFKLDKAFISCNNMGGQPSNENKPEGAFLYDSEKKKLILQTPSLNGAPQIGNLRYFVQVIIPLF